MKSIYLLMILVSSGLSFTDDTAWDQFCSEEYFDRITQNDYSKPLKVDFYRTQRGSLHHWVLDYKTETNQYYIVEYNPDSTNGYETEWILNFEPHYRLKLHPGPHQLIGQYYLDKYELPSSRIRVNATMERAFLYSQDTRDPIYKPKNFWGLFNTKRIRSNFTDGIKLVGIPHIMSDNQTQVVYHLEDLGFGENRSINLAFKYRHNNISVTDYFGCGSHQSTLPTDEPTSVTNSFGRTTRPSLRPSIAGSDTNTAVHIPERDTTAPDHIPEKGQNNPINEWHNSSTTDPEKEGMNFWLRIGALVVIVFFIVISLIIWFIVLKKKSKTTESSTVPSEPPKSGTKPSDIQTQETASEPSKSESQRSGIQTEEETQRET